jgi:DNA-directed RNA polymerase I subunit RPA1
MHALIDYKAKCSLSGIHFKYFSADEVRKLSVKEITSAQSLDRLLNPIQNGLYDLALGPLDKDDVCLTCGLGYFHCPGHFGHVEVALPVYNPVFFKELVRLMRAACFSCHHLVTNEFEKSYFCARMRLINLGYSHKLPLAEELYIKIISDNDESLLSRASFQTHFDQLISFVQSMEPEAHSDQSSRNAFRCKIDVIKDFVDNKLKANRQICPNCTLPLRQLRAEHNSKLFYAKGVAARQMHKLKSITRLKSNNSLNGERIALFNDEDEANEMRDSGTSDEFGLMFEQVNHSTDRMQNGINEAVLQSDSEEDRKLNNLSQQTYLTPIEARKHLKKLTANEPETIAYLLGLDTNVEQVESAVSNLFFFDTVAVPPSKYRPISQFKEQRFENTQTAQLSKLVQQNHLIKEMLIEIIQTTTNKNDQQEKQNEDSVDASVHQLDEHLTSQAVNRLAKKAPSMQEKLQLAWLQLQSIVNVLYDADLDKLNVNSSGGLKQLLEKKQGLFRKHMMGKRVNYAGRSVISPDVYIGADELGVPEVFAKKLTYPQPVNAVNFWEMRQLVLNGPDVHPGACLVEYGNGNIVRLKGKDYESRLAIAKQLLTPDSSIDPNLDIKIVHRHLRNGDVLLFNRQPTLHRPSVMAHRARVLPNEKTFRFHYSNCKAYNADFDGDEMNAHLPQNEIARAEANMLMLSSEHYLVPKDGTPLGGLIHDHVVAGAALSMRGRFFDKADYQSLVYNSFDGSKGNIKTLPPALIKPKALWTGKQA